MKRVLTLVALLALVTPAFAADKFAGTWKINTQKSTGPEPTDAQQLVVVDDGDAQVITVTGKAPDGTAWTDKFSVPTKGGEGKIIDAKPYTAVSAKPMTANASDFTFTNDGKPVLHVHSVLSRDGKTMTSTLQRTGGPGKPGTYKDVWEKE